MGWVCNILSKLLYNLWYLGITLVMFIIPIPMPKKVIEHAFCNSLDINYSACILSLFHIQQICSRRL